MLCLRLSCTETLLHLIAVVSPVHVAVAVFRQSLWHLAAGAASRVIARAPRPSCTSASASLAAKPSKTLLLVDNTAVVVLGA